MRKFFPAVLLAVFLALTAGSSIAVAEGIFPDEWSRGELEMLKGQADAARKVLGSLSQMERLLLLMQAEKGDCKMALEVESKAKAGDSDAQWKLAWLYKEGACVKKDEEGTVRWLYEAAKQGHSEAALELGHAFYEGKGVEKNQYQAAIFMRQSAEAGIDLMSIKQILGHKTIQMTLRYSHLSPGHLRNAVAAIDRVMASNQTPTSQFTSQSSESSLPAGTPAGVTARF